MYAFEVYFESSCWFAHLQDLIETDQLWKTQLDNDIKSLSS